MLGRLVAWLAGGLGAALLYRRLRRRPAGGPDPAEELRRKLDASRSGTQPPAEPPHADPETPLPLDDRRRQVHERGRAALDDMRRSDGAA